jgi:hypothetical protein
MFLTNFVDEITAVPSQLYLRDRYSSADAECVPLNRRASAVLGTSHDASPLPIVDKNSMELKSMSVLLPQVSKRFYLLIPMRERRRIPGPLCVYYRSNLNARWES